MKLSFKIVFLFLLVNCAYSQRIMDKSSYYSFGIKFAAEANKLPNQSKDSVDIISYFKIMYDVLDFTQVNPLIYKAAFVATPTVEIIIKDNSNIIRKRIAWTDSIFVEKFDKTNSKNEYVYSSVKTTVQNSQFKISIQLIDKYGKPFEKKDIEINNDKSFANTQLISEPIYCISNDPDKFNQYTPMMLGSKLSFAENHSRIIIPVSYVDGFDNFNYSIKKTEDDENKIWGNEVNLTGRPRVYKNSDINIKQVGTKNIEFEILETKLNIGNKIGVLDIEIPSNLMVPGKYKLILYREASKDTLIRDFEVSWIDMPLSLRNPEYALNLMQYILTDEEFDTMDDGNNPKRFKKIIDYWKKQDPTSNTPYNEAMATYFARADFAFFNYQNVKEKDGAKTQRGKIYILHGAPDEVNSNLESEKPTEIWTYKKLNKKFIFTQNSQGILKLTEIK